MRKLKLTLLLILVCVIAATVSVSAAGPGLSTAEWPKSRHDVRNSGCSPTTTAAMPSIDWIADTSTNGVTGTDWSFGAWSGPVLDANNIYALDAGKGANGDLYCYTRNGIFNWVARKADNTSVMQFAWDFATYGGVSLWNDGSVDRVITTPGGTIASNAVNFYDKATGLLNGASVNVNPAKTRIMSNDAPTVGPDGTIYTFIGPQAGLTAVFGYSGGTVYAIDGLTRQIKWSWGANGTVPGGKSLGSHYGPMALTTINGKTVIFVTMAQDKVNDIVGATVAPFAGAPYNGKSLFALQDDGSTCSVLWSAQPAFNEWCPALSNDGKTLYVACEEAWQGDKNFPNTLYAYNAATGDLKWAINTHAEHFGMPAIGKDGTIYLTSGYWRTAGSSRYDASGKLIAVQDRGNTATINWTMNLDYESNSYLSSPVVTSGSQPAIYFGSTSGRLFAVQDLGYSYKLLWTYARPFAGYSYWPTPVIADNGSVITHWNRYIIAFKTGYDGSPLGINGYVKNKSGDPIPGAWVVAATTPTPLMGNASKYFVKTDANGYYSIAVPAGTYYVGAWVSSRLMGDTQTAVMASDTSHATLNDFILPLAGPNLCVGTGAVASTNDTTPSAPAVNAIDGNRSSFFSTNTAATSATGPSSTKPIWLMVDLGSNKSIGEATIRWNAWAIGYKLQALADDGSGLDPKVEASWTNATTIATGSGAIGGFPTLWDQYGGISEHTEAVRFPLISARWWRISCTSTGATRYFYSVYEFELRDGNPAGPDNGQCSGIRSMNDTENVLLEGKQITAVAGGGIPTDVAYIEDTERAGAVRIHVPGLASKNVGIGDRVGIAGKVATDGATGEKYVEVTTITKLANPRPLDAVVMNSRNAGDKASKGLFVKMTGKVSTGGSDYFYINDGGIPVKVKCGSIAQPGALSNVKVRGVLSSEGSSAVLLTRDAIDIAAADATSQPLPLAGAKKYFRDCIIAGPFTDSTITGASYQEQADNMMATDFIARTNTTTGVTESSVMPAIGEPVGPDMPDMTWKRYNGADDIIDFNAFFPGTGYKEFAAAYAVVYIYSPIYQTVDLTLGSDDELRVWFNGMQVFDDPSLQGVGYSQKSNLNSGAGIDLMPGLNTFVFKVINASGGFAYSANIVEWGSWLSTGKGWGDGNPIQGLGYYPDRP